MDGIAGCLVVAAAELQRYHGTVGVVHAAEAHVDLIRAFLFKQSHNMLGPWMPDMCEAAPSSALNAASFRCSITHSIRGTTTTKVEGL